MSVENWFHLSGLWDGGTSLSLSHFQLHLNPASPIHLNRESKEHQLSSNIFIPIRSMRVLKKN